MTGFKSNVQTEIPALRFATAGMTHIGLSVPGALLRRPS